ncbi:hypothetical protein H8D29_05525 [PVC group bacterium]|nr:hypothetical protein [PVC group bacterium]
MIKTILLFVSFALSGCGVRAPIAQYHASQLTASTPDAISLVVEFNISNTNDEPIHLLQYKYLVTVNNSTVYHGLAQSQRTLPRWSTVAATIPVVIPREYLLATNDLSWRLSGSLEYVSSGALAETLLDSRLWKPSTSIGASDSFVIPPAE